MSTTAPSDAAGRPACRVVRHDHRVLEHHSDNMLEFMAIDLIAPTAPANHATRRDK
ncbi:hypothetical protein [Streptomyces sp. NPDC005780]|uniref:hypothetical protein n=1 Tax=Streptomyces sp. NPDC005780 TaxID=3364730 RepID=UPI00367B7789